jgi:sugar/nucleoside kinase (ribokinase family)
MASSRKRILIADPVVEDRIYRLPRPLLSDLIDSFNLNSGKKTSVNDDGLYSLQHELADHKPHMALGGSGATIARTLKSLMPNLNVCLVTAIGESNSEILQIFKNAGIEVFPRTLSGCNIPVQPATTLMLMPEDGSGRTIATNSGTFGKIFQTLGLPVKSLIANCDILHLLLTNREEERLGSALVDALLEARWDMGKELWLNLPTHEKFARENAKYTQWLIGSAHIVLGNMDELLWTYETDDKQKALRLLRNDLENSALPKGGMVQEPIAFITDDKYASHVIRPYAEPVNVEPRPVKPEYIVNNGGAGDTALAGFLAAHIKGMSDARAINLAHTLAAQNLKQIECCLPDALNALADADPSLFIAYAAARPNNYQFMSEIEREVFVTPSPRGEFMPISEHAARSSEHAVRKTPNRSMQPVVAA